MKFTRQEFGKKKKLLVGSKLHDAEEHETLLYEGKILFWCAKADSNHVVACADGYTRLGW